MKIGIVTLPIQSNYGGILQAYAMQTILERLGHQVKVIGINPIKELPPKYIYLYRIWQKKVLKKDVHIFYERDNNTYVRHYNQHMQQFIEKYIHMRYIQSFNEIKPYEFDAFVVGSDQVWRHRYFTNDYNTSIGNAFLEFAKEWNVKRIAYAPSFGVDFWEYNKEETSLCAELASRFDAISIRESSGINLCSQYLGVKAKHVLDPTMLLDTKDYIQLFEKDCKTHSDGELLTYILDNSPEKTKYINKLSKETGYIPFSVISHNSNEVKPSIETWLRGFYDAKLIVTDSFHACVFSIIFNKPFSVIANSARGISRIKSLLELFHLGDKIVYNPSCSPLNIIEPSNERINSLREESIHFLEKNIY